MLRLLTPKCPECDGIAIGTVDMVLGTALLRHTQGTNDFEYAGETKVEWDSQRPVDHPSGGQMVTCENGHQWGSVIEDFELGYPLIRTVETEDRAWQPVEPNDYSRLACCFRVDGLLMHLTAIEVNVDADLGQKAANPDHEEELADVYKLASPDEPFDTIKINKRDYVIFATPSVR